MQLSRKLQRFRTWRKNKKYSIFHDLSEYIIFSYGCKLLDWPFKKVYYVSINLELWQTTRISWNYAWRPSPLCRWCNGCLNNSCKWPYLFLASLFCWLDLGIMETTKERINQYWHFFVFTRNFSLIVISLDWLMMILMKLMNMHQDQPVQKNFQIVAQSKIIKNKLKARAFGQ
jgi:hypothetical protein